MKRALFVFRRDFRVHGNPAWSRCVSWCKSNGAAVCPCFIYSDKQVSPRSNDYFSAKCYSAMRRFLSDLSETLDNKLAFFHVKSRDTDVIKALGVDAVFFNRDVTPFARARDDSIRIWCESNGVHCDGGDPGEGYCAWPCGSILTKSGGTVPKTFSAFYRYTRARDLSGSDGDSPKLPPSMKRLACPKGFEPRPPDPVEISLPPRARVADFRDYGATRADYKLCTTRASVYLKFGVVDIRDFLGEVRRDGVPDLERQLLWREFYYHLAWGYPEVLASPNAHIRPDRQRVAWGRPDKAKLRRWREGSTGDRLVDDAMRSLHKTGWLHNRLRMVVASYLVRELGVDWRAGEREFARLLIDYDPSQNSGGWQAMDAQIPGQEIKASTQRRKFGPVPDECARRPP